ncbi:MAG TPA: HAD family hydrolase [Candidatus Limnocylindrales bacterium]|nr:HAD family hydrolase [Candidatus Limnocylindrales bacterium]
MIDFEVKGAIFDVDDTLLDNKPALLGKGLHERSRLRAAHEVGRRHGIKELEQLSPEDNYQAFLTAPVHTLPAAVWNIMMMTGVADSEVINPDNLIFQEIVALKNELHADIILEEAEEVPGASAFVRALAETGLQDSLAIASSAIRRDVDLFLGKTGLTSLFPGERIITLESITHPKPNPEAFEAAFASLRLPKGDKSQVCAFEDDPRGIMSAQGAGLFVCAIATRYSREQLLNLEVPPHLVADTYAEFTQLFGLAS